ncbi:MAG: hypothetical protein Q8M95_11095 [Candidatus Methanoperedens sp.]|nr:hypothetical protein [Candidatus Methanoperedens sp.]
MVRELNRIADEEHVDRTTVIRKLISGAIENYKKGVVLRKVEEYMVREGFKSKYSVADLKRELGILDESRRFI